MLVEKCASIDAMDCDECTTLMLAVHKGHTEVAEILVNQGASVNAMNLHGLAAVHVAARDSDTEMLKLLIEHRANINIDKFLTLMVLWGGIRFLIFYLLRELRDYQRERGVGNF